MTHCIRICSAYSLRVSKRSATNILIAVFFIAMIVIFQRYAVRHHGIYPHYTIGNFDYRPGEFLQNVKKNNFSFCQFNYGFPENPDWAKIYTYGTPEKGGKSPYRVIYNAIIGTAYDGYANYNTVTYATHATPEFMYHVTEIARYWDGPISLALYVPSYDLRIAMQVLDHLCHCYSAMDKVSVHLFYPKIHPAAYDVKEKTTIAPKLTNTLLDFDVKRDEYHKLNDTIRVKYIQQVRENKALRMMEGLINKKANWLMNLTDCSGTENIQTYRREHGMIYPINVARNIARNASKTIYFIVSDIEMVPSEGLAPKFLKMLSKLMGSEKIQQGCVFTKTVFVVPLFEVVRGVQIPRNKDTLVQQVSANHATYFHEKVCTHCQRFPGLQSWLKRPPSNEVEPLVVCRREYPYHRWEPLYFGSHKDPFYSEVLSWEGKQDKMTQMLELCLLDYKLIILDGAFFVHAASRPTPSNPGAQRINARKYLHIIDDLKKKYKGRSQCRVR